MPFGINMFKTPFDPVIVYQEHPRVLQVLIGFRNFSDMLQKKEPVAKAPVYSNDFSCEIPKLDIPYVGRNHFL